jgi:anti-anti-sigma regulatory factor
MIDGQRLAETMQAAEEKLAAAEGDSEVVLDFSSVARIDPNALRALEKLAAIADEKAIKLVLRGVTVSVYKVLRLSRLTSRYSCVK